ncbi:MAG TPA: hypothetical protein VIH61_09115 [Waddliaceae bacterium]
MNADELKEIKEYLVYTIKSLRTYAKFDRYHAGACKDDFRTRELLTDRAMWLEMNADGLEKVLKPMNLGDTRAITNEKEAGIYNLEIEV